MDNMEVYCEECKIETHHDVLEMKEGTDCWLEIHVKCSKCGREHEINLFC